MNMVLSGFIICCLLPLLVFFAAWALGLRSIQDREKSSPFECGFDPKSSARVPFSMRFFLLAIIFIVFDIEIVLLTPIPLIVPIMSLNYSLIGSFSVLLILMVGLVYEWKEGSLDWSY